jgi:Dullard-like phosphatase family protein
MIARPLLSSSSKPVLVVDLDETIIYCTALKVARDSFPIKIGRRRMHVQIRPYVQECLSVLADRFDIVVFTAASKEYTDQIIDKAFPFITGENRFYSDSCKYLSGCAVKDLSILGRAEQRIMLIDDMHCSALLQPQNAFIVPPWMDEPEDAVFRDLLPLLVQAGSVSNVVDELKTALMVNDYKFVAFDWRKEEISDEA